jgi:hypothetical protein
MANLSEFVKQLKDERARVEKQLSALNAGLTAFVGAYSGSAKSKGTRKMSAAASKNWPRTKGTLGKARGIERNEYGEAHENDVSRGAKEDCGCSACEVGQGQKTECLVRCPGSNPDQSN